MGMLDETIIMKVVTSFTKIAELNTYKLAQGTCNLELSLLSDTTIPGLSD